MGVIVSAVCWLGLAASGTLVGLAAGGNAAQGLNGLQLVGHVFLGLGLGQLLTLGLKALARQLVRKAAPPRVDTSQEPVQAPVRLASVLPLPVRRPASGAARHAA